MQNPPVHPGRCRNRQGDSDLLSGCVKSGRGAQRRCTGRLCSHRRRRLWLPGRRCPEPRCTIIIEGFGLRNKGGICRKTTAEVGTVAQRRAALQRSCKIYGAGLTNGSGRGKVMGGKGQSAFYDRKRGGRHGTCWKQRQFISPIKEPDGSLLHAGERPGCA